MSKVISGRDIERTFMILAAGTSQGCNTKGCKNSPVVFSMEKVDRDQISGIGQQMRAPATLKSLCIECYRAEHTRNTAITEYRGDLIMDVLMEIRKRKQEGAIYLSGLNGKTKKN